MGVNGHVETDRRRVRAKRKLEIRAAKAAAARAERAAREDAARRLRAARAEDRRGARAAGAERRAELAATVGAAGRRLRPVAPLLIVTGFAMYGQVAYGLEEYSPAGTPLPLRLLVAVGAAVAVESIALYVAWHAHDALLQRATATAARLRRASYAIAGAVAAVNYAHFADGWEPTPGAVVFALFSASGPWLWGLHTRRAQRMQLLREGQVDTSGAVFSAERFRAFPLRTIGARRWSIDHGVTDPREAWEGYRLDRAERIAARQSEKAAHRAEREADESPATAAEEPAPHPMGADRTDEKGLSLFWQSVPVAQTPASVPSTKPAPRAVTKAMADVDHDKAARLVRQGNGRAVLERELGCSEYVAKELVKRYRNNNEETTS